MSLQAAASGDREAYPKGKQSPFRLRDCFSHATHWDMRFARSDVL